MLNSSFQLLFDSCYELNFQSRSTNWLILNRDSNQKAFIWSTMQELKMVLQKLTQELVFKWIRWHLLWDFFKDMPYLECQYWKEIYQDKVINMVRIDGQFYPGWKSSFILMEFKLVSSHPMRIQCTFNEKILLYKRLDMGLKTLKWETMYNYI